MNILIVDDDPGVRQLLTEFITEFDHTVTSKASGDEALEGFKESHYDLLFLDLQMPGMDGIEVLQRIKEIDNECEVIIMTAYGSISSAIRALNTGAYAYLNKPFELNELNQALKRVQELVELRQAYRLLANERLRSFHLDNLIAVSPMMKFVKDRIIELGDNTKPILLIGESGVGKRFIARLVHFQGRGKESLILQLNPEDIESLIEKGRLHHPDGVTTQWNEFPIDLIRQGYGTVIFNSINNLFPDLMIEFCTGLEERQNQVDFTEKYPGFRLIGLYETVGGSSELETVVNGRLRSTFSEIIHIPPLRERKECIVPLTQLMLQRHVIEKGGRNFYIAQPAREFLKLYEWPGNISELKFMVDRLANICTSRLVSIDELRHIKVEYFESSGKTTHDLTNLLSQAEKAMISKTFRLKSEN